MYDQVVGRVEPAVHGHFARTCQCHRWQQHAIQIQYNSSQHLGWCQTCFDETNLLSRKPYFCQIHRRRRDSWRGGRWRWSMPRAAAALDHLHIQGQPDVRWQFQQQASESRQWWFVYTSYDEAADGSRYINSAAVCRVIDILSLHFVVSCIWLVLMHHGQVAVNISEYFKRTTRNYWHSHNLAYQVPVASVDCIKFYVFPRTACNWNMLPFDVVIAPSLNSFRARLRREEPDRTDY